MVLWQCTRFFIKQTKTKQCIDLSCISTFMYKIKSACTVADDHQVLVANETTYGKALTSLA